MWLQHSSKATSQHHDAAKETGPNADIGKVEGVYEGGRSEYQGTNLLDKTRDSAYDKMGGGGHGTTGQTGNNSLTGNRTQTGNNQIGSTGQTGTNQVGTAGSAGTNQSGYTGQTGGAGQGNQGSSY